MRVVYYVCDAAIDCLFRAIMDMVIPSHRALDRGAERPTRFPTKLVVGFVDLKVEAAGLMRSISI
ncbi:protein of unknown function [Cyanobium sp. NIES-981]|nr:protein of unknown function [Cyanobium sp. NIES-981]